jgi:hypothetical protein
MQRDAQPILRALREGENFSRLGFDFWKGDGGCAHRSGLRLVNRRLRQIKEFFQRFFKENKDL